MLFVALAAVVIGLVILVMLGWFGLVVGGIGLILLTVYVIGAVRRPASGERRPS